MVVNFSLAKQENCHNDASSLNYCELYAKQLTDHYPGHCIRLVYYESGNQKHQEVVNYKQKPAFSAKYLAYLRSELWLEDFPHVFEVRKFQLTEIPGYSCYVCIFGYRNHQPEYIQIVTDENLSIDLQNQLKESAIILNQYLQLYSENVHKKAEIQYLEHILHKAGHQLRNSLALIGLYAHNLHLRSPDISSQKQAMVIHENIQNLNSKLTEILSCGQGVILNIVPQDLKEILAESIENIQPIIEQKKIKIEVTDTSTIVSLDKLQIQQVFDNIISNAIHFSPDFGKITISWQTFQEEILIKISDQGTGIPSEDMQKIFNPFYSHRAGGTGLGLTIAKKIVLDHQGSIWVQNLAEGGAAFSIILPRR
ncbi:HAMP domain-containing histidine kinase [Plectonema cf. radiosum LEGE 06105]|uniref:histidine kinase n=1 Tax=Plectonema cf. radiosum LEGE 06105 TaxID=945769 RepID=A0A8J7K6Y3_9CYAN|nr:HAMP domain-containing sensor histidine kinase [Plectonema radiosum]MBE9216072.1 HAMP domain-containing histidine kinase [Plectonema cf. radiosum LEGE 06105]